MTKQNSVYVVYEIDWKTFQFFSKQGGLVFYRSPFLIQVLGKRMGAFNKLAIKDRYIKVSETTRNEFYDSVARNFYDLAKETSFNEAAEEFGLIIKESGNVRLEYPQVTINNNGQPQYTSLGLYGPYELNKDIDIAKWAFNNEVGHIMEPEDISENLSAISTVESVLESSPKFITHGSPFIALSIEERTMGKDFSALCALIET